MCPEPIEPAPAPAARPAPDPAPPRGRARPRIAVDDDRLDRERDLILAAQAGDQSAAEQLLAAYKPLIERAASAWRRPGIEADDLRQAARIGVLSAIGKWRPGRGRGSGREAGLARLARLEADNACRECVRTHGGPLVLPRSGAVEAALRHRDAIAAEIDEATAAGVSVAEAERAACSRRGITPELYADAITAATASSRSTGAESTQVAKRAPRRSPPRQRELRTVSCRRYDVGDGACELADPIDLLPSDQPDPEQALLEAEEQARQPERLRRLHAALELLPDDERKAMAARLRGSAPTPTLRAAEARAMERLRGILVAEDD